MELLVLRNQKTKESTIGELFINSVFECYTLEDVEREEKVYGKTAIPKGRYEVIISWSNRFKKFLPLLLNVKNFEGIRIHAGNTAKNTEGCILVGKGKGENVISNSRIAYERLFNRLEIASKKEKIYITIK
jgi:hypothetical protein